MRNRDEVVQAIYLWQDALESVLPEPIWTLCRGSGNQARNVLGGLSSLPGIWPTKETVAKEIRCGSEGGIAAKSINVGAMAAPTQQVEQALHFDRLCCDPFFSLPSSGLSAAG